MTYRGMAAAQDQLANAASSRRADANTLVKAGVPVEEIIASLFEAVVYQNLATLTKGNTPTPEVLLLGGPNLFFKGLQEAWRHHLSSSGASARVALPDRAPDDLIRVPADALYYASLGCVEVAKAEGQTDRTLCRALTRLRWWIEQGQHELKAKEGSKGLVASDADLGAFLQRYGELKRNDRSSARSTEPKADRPYPDGPVLIGCDFGSTTAKAVVVAPDMTLLFTCYVLSKGNPIEDAKDLFRQIRAAGFHSIGALALTGYGKDLLKDIVGADVAVVETVAHARAALHFFPDADVICDVGGCDVKIMLLRQGTVTDFRLNSQCSSGNGAFLQGVAERYGVPLESYAERAFQAKSMPALAMGCGVFLQSDIVNQQRKGWSAEEIMASLAAVLPLNVWVYAGQLQNLRAVGRKFVLQGGTHRNLAVVKAQVDFITGKVPDAEVVVHPYSGEAGAIGAALCALDAWRGGEPSRFRGFDAIEALSYRSTTNEETVCRWCACNCKRTFIDVELPGGDGTAVEQGAARRRLGTRHQRQFLPEGPGRGRERDADREGQARGGQACLSQRGGNGSQRRVPSNSRRQSELHGDPHDPAFVTKVKRIRNSMPSTHSIICAIMRCRFSWP